MKRLRQSYRKLRKLFLQRKGFYKGKVDSWKKRGLISHAERGQFLFDKAEALVKEINDMLTTPLTTKENVVLKKKIKKFKEVFKELHESTKPVWRQWIEAIVVAGVLAFVLRTYVFGLYHVPTGSAEKNILVGDRLWGSKFSYLFAEPKIGDLVIFDKPGFVYDKSNPLKYFWQKYIGLPIPFFGLSDVPENWVKRVIGVPGDKIEGRVENGRTVVYRNDKKLEEDYVNTYPLIRIKKQTGFFSFDSIGPFVVPSFLRKQTRLRIYTYDPNLPLEEQPYYNMQDSELVRSLKTGNYLLEHAYTPNRNPYGGTYDNFGPFTVPEGKLWVMGDSRKNSEDSRYWGYLDKGLIHGKASFVIYSVDSEEPFWLFELIKHPISFWRENVRWRRSFRWLK